MSRGNPSSDRQVEDFAPPPSGPAPGCARGPMTVDLNGCARCHSDGHPGLTFTPLTHPLQIGSEAPLTHWAPCPTNGEPILMLLQQSVPEED